MKTKDYLFLICIILSIFIFPLLVVFTPDMEANNKYLVIGTQIEEIPGPVHWQGGNQITELVNVYYLILQKGKDNYKLEVTVDYFNQNGNFGTVINLPQKRKTDLVKI